MRPLLIASLLAAFALACRTDGPAATEAPPAGPATPAIPYDFDDPDAVFRLPPALVEISGLTVLADGRLGAVQDEQGILYVLDPDTGAVVEEHRFDGAGDYEGVERVGETVWVLRSDGDLFAVTEARGEAPQREKHETGLPASCDAEGLGYDPGSGAGAAPARLLIVCKEDAGPELPGIRAIYAFDLSAMERAPAPVFRLDRSVLDAPPHLFKPSALAVHPRTGEVYVFSSVRKALAVLSPDGALRAAVALPDVRFPQPEGLAFGADGTLYVSNEGRSGAATLLRFREQPTP